MLTLALKIKKVKSIPPLFPSHCRTSLERTTMDLSLGLEGTHVLITGGAGHIGKTVVAAFLSAGAKVSSLDIAYPQGQQPPSTNRNLQELYGDTSLEASLVTAWELAVAGFGPVETCVALAALDLSVLPHVESAADMSIEQFRRTLDVNVIGTFAVARQWLRGLRMHKANIFPRLLHNVSLIIIGSESGHWGERGNPDYGTSKAAVQYGLLQSLRQDVPRVHEGARVNAVAPGPVNTPRFPQECMENPAQFYNDCVGTTALKKPVEMEQVAKTILFLASEKWSGSVHGQIVNVDSGKLGKIVWEKGEESSQ
jgi:NAD(P)-dependent dehydrogenase (short-subunit alcohol dehydrogenase family)